MSAAARRPTPARRRGKDGGSRAPSRGGGGAHNASSAKAGGGGSAAAAAETGKSSAAKGNLSGLAVAQAPVTLDLVPGASLGPFRLGVGVTQALELLAREYETFARAEIVCDSEGAAPTADVLVQVPRLGVCLRFEPVTQQLRRVDFWPSEFLTVTYKSRVVMKPGVATRHEPTHHLFGPCAGEHDRASGCYLLRYPGVSLGFAAAPVRPGSASSDAVTTLNPDAPLKCGAVHSVLDAKAASSPGKAPVRVRAVPGTGLLFEDGREALFGDSCQDVVRKLGAPCATFRPVDPAWIGAAGAGDRGGSAAVGGVGGGAGGSGVGGGGGGGGGGVGGEWGRGDDAGVFFNYRRFGLDVWFEPRRHRAAKFVLHANVPGHYDFGVYTKCNFACEVRGAAGGAASSASGGSGSGSGSGGGSSGRADSMLRSCIDAQPGLSEDTAGDSFKDLSDTLSAAWDSGGSSDDVSSIGDGAPATAASDADAGGSRLRAVLHAAAVSSSPSMLVTPETKWSAVLRQFKLAKPVAMQPPPAPNTVNPFGATHLYNDGPFVFEVVPATGKIATVTLTPNP